MNLKKPTNSIIYNKMHNLLFLRNRNNGSLFTPICPVNRENRQWVVVYYPDNEDPILCTFPSMIVFEAHGGLENDPDSDYVLHVIEGAWANVSDYLKPIISKALDERCATDDLRIIDKKHIVDTLRSISMPITKAQIYDYEKQAATMIEEAFMNAWYNPMYLMCQNRLRKEFKALTQTTQRVASM